MKSRLLAVVTATLLLAALFGNIAYAASGNVAGMVDSANASITQEISKAIVQANQADSIYRSSVDLLQGNKSPQATMLLAACRAWYDSRLDQIAGTLIARTNQISRDTIQAAQGSGVVVVCVYVEVKLGDRVYMVDPLLIAGD